MKYAFFPGCMIQVRYPQMEAAVRLTAPKLGIELVDLEGLSCCPDPVFYKSLDKLDWLTVAARNLAVAEGAGLDYTTICSGCTETLGLAAHMLAEDAELLARVNERLARIDMRYGGKVRTKHLVTVLRDEVGYERVAKSVERPLAGLRVGVHYGCHLLKPRAVMQVDDPDSPRIFEDLLQAVGAEPVDHAERVLCCGKSCRDCTLPEEMTLSVLNSLHAAEAEIMGVICPSCFNSFDVGQIQLARRHGLEFTMPPVYYFQLLALAQGFVPAEVGLDRHKLKPERLLAEFTPAG